ncbi:hypothetical protein CVT24_007778 [Panaeolus cyanescens]|uniref:F-box domain-containing protein n=1 Tax=Panaeolus cyanescens TaxID=181874 RepID=A0A409YM54_9AGAR|nr:hypothetical protein CVT24_007778 [Panaeolus cyanescens]
MITAHSAQRATALDEMPVDILLYIFKFLKAKDILSIRKTCKNLESATRGRVVWLEAARRMIKDNVLYEPSFDLGNMAQLQLEHLSMGSHRFHRLLQKAIKIVNVSLKTLFPQLHSTHHNLVSTRTDGTLVNKMHLVPGGRFLVTLQDRRGIEIIDLPYFTDSAPGDTNIQPCVSIADPDVVHFSIHPAPDPKILRLRLRFTRQSIQSASLFVTEIVDMDLSCTPPVVRRFGKMRIAIPNEDDSRALTSINKDMFVLVFRTLITVWNCVTKKAAQWTMPVDAAQLFITETEVIVLSRCYYGPEAAQTGVYIFKIPPLTLDEDTLATYQTVPMVPYVFVPLPSGVEPYNLNCRGSCDWYTGSTSMIWFDLIHPRATFTRIKLVNDSDGNYRLESLPGSTLGCQPDMSHQSCQRTYDNGEMTLAWWTPRHHDAGVSCHFGDTFPSFQSEISEETVALLRDEYGILGGAPWASLCATCKNLENATRGRVVWLEAARRMIKDNVLYEPSFDLDNMAQLQLEHLSMGSHQFHRLLQKATKGAEGPLKPLFTPKLYPTRRNLLSIGADATLLNRMHLIPGGRFLVTLHHRRAIEIRDLSYFTDSEWTPDDTNNQPCVSIADPDVVYFTIHPAPDPKVIRLRLRFTTLDTQGTSRLFVTEIVDVDLSCTPPVVRRSGKMGVDVPPENDNGGIFTSVNKDIFVLVSGFLITVWNCVNKKGAQWTVPVSAAQFFITDTEVMIISPFYYDMEASQNGVYIYKIPPLTLDNEALATYQAASMAPYVFIPLPSEVEPYYKCRGSCDWYTGSTNIIWFDLIHPRSKFTRMKLVADSDGGYRLDRAPTSTLGYQRDDALSSRQRMYDNDEKTLAWWTPSRQEAGVSCHFGDTFPSFGSEISEEEEKVALVCHEFGILGGESWASLCAVSGRLVYAAARHSNSMPGNSLMLDIFVRDFLTPSSDDAT